MGGAWELEIQWEPTANMVADGLTNFIEWEAIRHRDQKNGHMVTVLTMRMAAPTYG